MSDSAEAPRPILKQNGVAFDDGNYPEKLWEDQSGDFKRRQRRRSSATPLAVAGLPKAANSSSSSGRRASTVSAASSYACKWHCYVIAVTAMSCQLWHCYVMSVCMQHALVYFG